MRNSHALALAVGLMGLGASAGNAVVLQREEDFAPRINEFRRGRRHFYGFPSFAQLANGQNPPGTKLLKKMRKGTLTKNGIR